MSLGETYEPQIVDTWESIPDVIVYYDSFYQCLRPISVMPAHSIYKRKRPNRDGWIPYQEGGLTFHENIERIRKLVKSHNYEWKKVGITWYVRALKGVIIFKESNTD